MRPMHLVMLGFALSFPLPSAAQSGAAQDTTQPAPKKHGGLFGKVKGLAKNKVVQQVAKTAACNMVPGGQLVAGAIDKASAMKAAKNAAKDAAKGAVVGAALGAAGGKSTCGSGLMGGLGSAGLAKGVAGVGIPGMPTTGMPGVGASADQMKQMAEQYQKMGMNPAQIKAMQQQMQMAAAGTPAPAMQGASLSPEQMKQMAEQYQKMGMDPAQIKAMQQMMAGMNPAAAAGSAVAAPSAAVTPSAEAVPAPTLKKGKNRFELRQLPWLPRSEAIQPGAEATFAGGIHSLATQLQPGTRQYKIELKVEDQGSKEQSQLLAQKRAAVVVSFLVAQGLSESQLVIGDGAPDKDARVVISESKSGK
jgi:outer membrane protein OmpA-like peptidoglycan-associated protein